MAIEINDEVRLSNALNHLSSYRWIQGQHRKAIELGNKALKYADKAGHFSYKIGTMMHLGIYYFNIGNYLKQIEIHQRVRKHLIGEKAFKRHGMASLPGALSRSMLVFGMAETGNFDKIDIIGHEALDIAEKVQNALTLTFVYNFLAMAYLRLGKIEPALLLLEKSLEQCRVSELQSMYSFTVANHGYACLLAKDPMRALKSLIEGSRDDYLQASFWPSHPLTILADAYRAVGNISLAFETISRALKLTDQREERGFEAWSMFVNAEINSADERYEESIQWYLRALHQASGLSMRPLTAHCHKGLALSYRQVGKEKEALMENKAASKLYNLLGMTLWLES